MNPWIEEPSSDIVSSSWQLSLTLNPFGAIGVMLGLHWGYIGKMEHKMETTIVYRGYIGLHSP